jgi:hypothetical protein
LVEPCADLGCIGVLQVLEYDQGLLPDTSRFQRVPCGVVDFAEMGEHLGFLVTVAEVPEDMQGAMMAVGGIGEVAELVLDVAEAVPGVRLAEPVGQLEAQRKSLPAEGLGLLVGTQPAMAPADIVEGRSLHG